MEDRNVSRALLEVDVVKVAKKLWTLKKNAERIAHRKEIIRRNQAKNAGTSRPV